MSTPMVNVRALRWAGVPPTQLYSLDIDGTEYLTDHYILLPTERLGGLPVGYGNQLVPLTRQAVDGLAMWLAATVGPTASDRLFECTRIDPLEQAGFEVRPLDHVKEAHGVCEGLQLVGLITPVRRRREATAAAGTIRVAR